MDKHKIKAILFDMDGVLIDSEPYHFLATQQMLLQEFGIKYTKKESQEFLGRSSHFCAQTIIKRYSLNSTPEAMVAIKRSIFIDLLRNQGKELPGVRKTLEEGNRLGLPLALASSSGMSTIKLVIDKLGFKSFFQAIASGEEVAQVKPAPDIFLLAAQRLNVSPENCLVIEDTLNGIKAAIAAGMRCIAIPCEETKHEDHSIADLILPSMEELRLADWI